MKPWRKESIGPFAVYRMFNAAGDLLYIGQSNQPHARVGQLSWSHEWISEVCSMKVEWLPTRADALAAEARAIKAELPRYNVTHNPAPTAPRKKQIAGPILREWLERTGISMAEFDVMIKAPRGYTRKLVECEVAPSKKAFKIEEATGGEIPHLVWNRGGWLPRYCRPDSLEAQLLRKANEVRAA